MSNARGGFGGRGGGGGGYRGGGGGGGIGGLLLNPQVIGIFTNLFLQLPFSRRAEAEADLIGLKLMGLAGYDPKVGIVHLPHTVLLPISCLILSRLLIDGCYQLDE